MSLRDNVVVNGYHYKVQIMHGSEVGYSYNHKKRQVLVHGLNPAVPDDLWHINIILDYIGGTKVPANNGESGRRIMPSPIIIALGLEDMV